MHAAVLYLTDTADATLDSHLDGGLPAADTEATQYLDGKRIHHGTLAGEITEPTTQVIVGDGAIVTESEERFTETATGFYADLSAGWAGVASSDAGSILGRYLVSEASITPEPAALRLDSWVEHYGSREDADVWSVSFANEDEAAARFHDAARNGRVPTQGVSAFGFSYQWDGRPMRGMLAASGYVALYSDVPVETFAAWVGEEIHPYLELEGDEQTELGDSEAESGGEAA